MDDADLAAPLSIIYDGTNPDSRVAGFMYYSMSPKAPQGYAGPNDIWHFHENICLKYSAAGVDAPYGMDKSATKAQCERGRRADHEADAVDGARLVGAGMGVEPGPLRRGEPGARRARTAPTSSGRRASGRSTC